MKTIFCIVVTIALSLSLQAQQRLSSSISSNEGGHVSLLNPTKTTDDVASNWTIFNMTGPYSNSLQFWAYGNSSFPKGPKMTLSDNGDLGIGIQKPNAKLDIRTKIDDQKSYNVQQWSTSNSGYNLGLKTKSDAYGINHYFVQKYNNVDYNSLSFFKGNVGIGTIIPSNKLTVGGNSGDKPLLLLRNDSYDGTSAVGTAALQFAFKNHLGPKIEAIKYAKNTTGLNFYTEFGFNIPQHGMTIKPSTRGPYVGIGTKTPNARLEVGVKHDLNQKEEMRIGSYWKDNFIGLGLQYSLSSTGSASKHIVEHHHGQEYKSITLSLGNVGIGTAKTDGYKLSVNGNIRATEVKVYTGWADYVFAADYKLPTLQEVAAHIQEKGHLINIPSAAEVAENGILLGEMNAKLLEKIEELTLYTLEQEEQLEKQKDINTALEARLDEIEKLFKK